MLTARRQRGIALIAVLWGMVLLSVIGLSVATTSRTETRLAHNLVENARAMALADAGVHRAVLRLLKPVVQQTAAVGPEMQSLLQRRPELEQVLLPETEDASPPQGEEVWRLDGTPYAWRVRGGEVVISVQDEAGKIDLNRAPDDQLNGLFLAVGLDPDRSAGMVDAIVDFRDRDDLRRLNGAEDPDYRAAGRAYGAKDGPFVAVDEVRQVLGMTPELYGWVAPALTVYSRRGRVNQATALPLVLQAVLGLNSEELEARLAERDAASVAGTVRRLRAQIVTIRAEAHTETGAVFVREAVVRLIRRGDQPFRIEAWRQGRRAVAAEEVN